MNIRKLKKLKAWILAEPRRYNQNTWIKTDMPLDYFVDAAMRPPCGTMACLAGSACLMEGYKHVKGTDVFVNEDGRHVHVSDLASKILGFEANDRKIFEINGEGWSEKAHSMYLKSTDFNGRAKAAAMELDRLIKLNSRKRKVVKSKSKR